MISRLFRYGNELDIVEVATVRTDRNKFDRIVARNEFYLAQLDFRGREPCVRVLGQHHAIIYRDRRARFFGIEVHAEERIELDIDIADRSSGNELDFLNAVGLDRKLHTPADVAVQPVYERRFVSAVFGRARLAYIRAARKLRKLRFVNQFAAVVFRFIRYGNECAALELDRKSVV